MSETLVSVIIPAHNAAAFIEETIASAQHQTLSAIEIIVVDDASTDDTSAIVKRLGAGDTRVRLITLRTNQGVAHARNIGVKAAVGQYVAFLDADDVWVPQKLAIQTAFLVEHRGQLGYGSYQLIDQSGAVIGERRITDATLDYRQMLRGNRIGMLTAIVDRQVAVSHPFPSIHNEDYACWLAIAKDGITAYRCGDELLGQYRKHASSTSANKLKAAGWTWAIFRKQEGMNFLRASQAFIQYVFMAITDRR